MTTTDRPRDKGVLCQMVGIRKYTASVLKNGGKRQTPSAKGVTERLVLRSPMATPGWPILSTPGIGKAKAPSQSLLRADREKKAPRWERGEFVIGNVT
jgi:hypothetical protein